MNQKGAQPSSEMEMVASDREEKKRDKTLYVDNPGIQEMMRFMEEQNKNIEDIKKDIKDNNKQLVEPKRDTKNQLK